MCANQEHKTKGVERLRTAKNKTEVVKTRISEELKKEFEECLKQNDDSQSEILRKCVRNYIRQTKRD